MVAVAAAANPSHYARTLQGSVHEELNIPNQDAHLSLPDSGIFTVLDGHGPEGHAIACRAAHSLVSNVADHLNGPSRSANAALLAAFTATAELIDSNPAAAISGSTASAVVVQGDLVTVANIGDSDVVWASGRTARVVSMRHRPNREVEKKRIAHAGGSIQDGYLCHQRLDKMIAVSRAFGDLDMRNVGVISSPDVSEFSWDNDDFLILATDGLWDAHGGISTQDAVRVVRACFERGETVREAVNDLLTAAKGRDRLPFDDTTILIIRRFPANRS